MATSDNQRQLPYRVPATEAGIRRGAGSLPALLRPGEPVHAAWQAAPQRTRAFRNTNDITSAVLVLASACVLVAAEDTRDGWVGRVRPDHPRLFFNADTWPAVKARALGVNRDHFGAVKVQASRATPKRWLLKDCPARRPGSAAETGDWGCYLMAAAFEYRVERRPEQLRRIRDMLWASLDYYHACYEARVAVDWYSMSRVSWLAALDWVWNDLAREERRELGAGMLRHVRDVQPGPGKPPIRRCNTSRSDTGFYGVRNLLWYAGLAMLNEGIDDEAALAMATEGRHLNLKMLAHRAPAAGDDGGSASSTLEYCLVAYPWAEWNFLYTWRSATGEDISGQWPHIATLSNYVLWNWLPGGYEFGYGDADHRNNRFPMSWLYTHLSHTMHFYGQSHPEWAAVARHVRERVEAAGAARYYSLSYSCYPFLMTDIEKAPAAQDPGKLPAARHFERMGQVFMRSGSGPDDTYALFVCGGRVKHHAHLDATHFTIYKNGFLALDSGSRYPTTGSAHCNNYYRQTIAHNCVLIEMPNEPGVLPFGTPVRAGGQRRHGGSEVFAFETSRLFTYVAGDATQTYRREKCSLMVRQFVFVPPSHFVVFDRVTSTKPDYAKTWLLHTANEPVVSGHGFLADQGQGRLACRTLLPAEAVIEKVGGPGQEFLVEGVNYPVESDVVKDGMPEAMGRWRVEVRPGAQRESDVFLHLIRVGDQSLAAIDPVEASQSTDQVEIRFTSGAETVTLHFATAGPAAGYVQIASQGHTFVSRPLTNVVMPQAGLAAAEHAFRTKEEIDAEISQPMRGARRVLGHDPPRSAPRLAE